MHTTFRYEKSLLHEGYEFIAGTDEVGLGSVAGPVYSVAVMFSKETILSEDDSDFTAELQMKNKIKTVRVDDSKKLSASARELLCKKLYKVCLCTGLGIVSIDEIESIQNIMKVGELAMTRAVNAMCIQPDYVIADGKNALDSIDIPNKAIIKGDQKSITIAGASIIAKVLRDQHMSSMSNKYPEYGWENNAGYLTKAHRQALTHHGVCNYHRKYIINKKKQKDT